MLIFCLQRRNRYRHLLEQPAGRDISFLYDATLRQIGLPPLMENNGGHLSVAVCKSAPDLVLHDSKYTTTKREIGLRGADHPAPLPALPPASRAEAIQVIMGFPNAYSSLALCRFV